MPAPAVPGGPTTRIGEEGDDTDMLVLVDDRGPGGRTDNAAPVDPAGRVALPERDLADARRAPGLSERGRGTAGIEVRNEGLLGVAGQEAVDDLPDNLGLGRGFDVPRADTLAAFVEDGLPLPAVGHGPGWATLVGTLLGCTADALTLHVRLHGVELAEEAREHSARRGR